MKKKLSRRSLIMYTLALFSAAAFMIIISYLYNMRIELEKELADVRMELDEANQRYEDLLVRMEGQ